MLAARQALPQVEFYCKFFENRGIFLDSVHSDIKTSCFLLSTAFLQVPHSSYQMFCECESMVKVLEQNFEVEFLQLFTIYQEFKDLLELIKFCLIRLFSVLFKMRDYQARHEKDENIVLVQLKNVKRLSKAVHWFILS